MLMQLVVVDFVLSPNKRGQVVEQKTKLVSRPTAAKTHLSSKPYLFLSNVRGQIII